MCCAFRCDGVGACGVLALLFSENVDMLLAALVVVLLLWMWVLMS